jgi:hypothetical protein
MVEPDGTVVDVVLGAVVVVELTRVVVDWTVVEVVDGGTVVDGDSVVAAEAPPGTRSVAAAID